ncbi:hypothetical protein D9M69_582860 [compost metagenome]
MLAGRFAGIVLSGKALAQALLELHQEQLHQTGYDAGEDPKQADRGPQIHLHYLPSRWSIRRSNWTAVLRHCSA